MTWTAMTLTTYVQEVIPTSGDTINKMALLTPKYTSVHSWWTSTKFGSNRQCWKVTEKFLKWII